MSIANQPTEEDWSFIERLCRTLEIETGGNLHRVSKRRDNIAKYQLVDTLGLDNEEKCLIFNSIFKNEIWRAGEGGESDEEIYAVTEN